MFYTLYFCNVLRKPQLHLYCVSCLRSLFNVQYQGCITGCSVTAPLIVLIPCNLQLSCSWKISQVPPVDTSVRNKHQHEHHCWCKGSGLEERTVEVLRSSSIDRSVFPQRLSDRYGCLLINCEKNNNQEEICYFYLILSKCSF